MLWLYKYTFIWKSFKYSVVRLENIWWLCWKQRMSNYVWEVCESRTQEGGGGGAIVPFYRRVFYRNTELGDGKVWFFDSFVIVVFC